MQASSSTTTSVAYWDCSAGVCGSMIVGALMDVYLKRKSKHIQSKHPPYAQDEISTLLNSMQQEFDKLPEIIQRSSYKLTYYYHNEKHIGSGLFQVKINQKFANKHHHHNNYLRIRNSIDHSNLTPTVKQIALKIFHHLAEAEATVHNTLIEDIHFHEVGAIDSIIDIIGSAYLINRLQLTKMICSPINLGSGRVDTQHGSLAVPTPATIILLQGYSVYGDKVGYELCTPTGAAIIKTLAVSHDSQPPMKVSEIGIGAGSHSLPYANILRIIIGNEISTSISQPTTTISSTWPENQQQTLIKISTNIDDMTPEQLAPIMKRALALKACDVWLVAICMKKNRLATQMNILCHTEQVDVFTDLIFSQTMSLGLRIEKVSRLLLKRKKVLLSTKQHGDIAFKISCYKGVWRGKPEHESIEEILKHHPQLSYMDIQRYAQSQINEYLLTKK